MTADPRGWEHTEEQARSMGEKLKNMWTAEDVLQHPVQHLWAGESCCVKEVSWQLQEMETLTELTQTRRLISATIQLREAAMCLKFENWPTAKMLSEHERSLAMQPRTPKIGKHSVRAGLELKKH